MAAGGKRPGAGRKPGTVSAATSKRKEIAEKALSEGVNPLDVMLKVMREAYASENWKDALAAAKEAAPYVHPKLSAVAHEGHDGGPVQHIFEVVTGIDRTPGED